MLFIQFHDHNSPAAIFPLNIVATRSERRATASAEQEALINTIFASSPTFGQDFFPSFVNVVIPPAM